MKKTIKVLQTCMGEVYGGIESLELKYLNNINDKFIKLDVLAPNKNSFNNHDNKNIYTLDITRNSFINRMKYDYRLYKFLKKNKYDIVHINSSAFFYSFRVVIISKLCKVKKIIVHSHGICYSNKFKRFIINILNPIYVKMIDEYLSCSETAKESLFTKNFISKNKIKILKNGIDVDKYKFNSEIRDKYRNDLKIANKMVYCHVGRFSQEKNHEFLIDLFYKIQKKQDNAVLLLIGDGPLKSQVEDKVKKLQIEDKVQFLGFRNDINNLLFASDIFLFPSFHEGLPLSLVEAQTSGLPVIVSNNISNESKVSNDFIKIDNYDIDKWIKAIFNLKNKDRKNAYKDAIKSGYDIKFISKELKQIYNDTYNN